MKALAFSVIFMIAYSAVQAWSNIPTIPSNRRSQFYLRHDDGAYKYGYDSGDGSAAHQKSTGENQVEGFYSYPNEAGEIVNVKYTAGVEGFVPEITGVNGQSSAWQVHQAKSVKVGQQSHQIKSSHTKSVYEEPNVDSDASYKISYNTGDHAREENSDSSGNVQGRYSYTDELGTHDLTYIAGPKTGFVVTGGSLANPSGLSAAQASRAANQGQVSRSFNHAAKTSFNSQGSSWSSSKSHSVQKPEDGSYKFAFDSEDHARSETSDASGNVQGRYSYTDELGTHDLTYKAGPETGFIVTGGSLSQPNGLVAQQASVKSKKVWSTPVPREKALGWLQTQSYWKQSPVKAAVASNTDINQDTQNPNGSAYAFFYNADSHARQEESDASGNVRGSYAIRTGTGFEELEYQAGKDGFVVTGGSLAPKPPSWEDTPATSTASFTLEQQFGDEQGQNVEDPFPDRGFFRDGRPRPLQIPTDHRPYSMDKSVHPTFTIVAPSNTQKSFEYGPKNALVLGFLPPKHDEKHGYIYDTSK